MTRPAALAFLVACLGACSRSPSAEEIAAKLPAGMKHVAIPLDPDGRRNAHLLVPEESSLRVEHVVEPAKAWELANAELGSDYPGFLVDDNGGPLLLDGAHGRAFDPREGLRFVSDPFVSMAWKTGGPPVVCLKDRFGFVSFPGRETDGPGRMHFSSYAPIPGDKCRVYAAGRKDSFYIVTHDTTTNMDALFLANVGRNSSEKIIRTRTPITAAAGDGRVAYISGGSVVYRLDKTTAAAEAYYDAKAPVTALAYSKELGLILATDHKVSFVTSVYNSVFLSISNAQIEARGADLYVRGGAGFNVLRITGLDKAPKEWKRWADAQPKK